MGVGADRGAAARSSARSRPSGSRDRVRLAARRARARRPGVRAGAPRDDLDGSQGRCGVRHRGRVHRPGAAPRDLGLQPRCEPRRSEDRLAVPPRARGRARDPLVPAARRLRCIPRVRRAGDRPVERVVDDAARRPRAPLVGRGVRGVRHRPDAAASDRGAAERARPGRRLAARGHRAHGEHAGRARLRRRDGRHARCGRRRAGRCLRRHGHGRARLRRHGRAAARPLGRCRAASPRRPRELAAREPRLALGWCVPLVPGPSGERRGGAGIAHGRGRVRAAEPRRRARRLRVPTASSGSRRSQAR